MRERRTFRLTRNNPTPRSLWILPVVLPVAVRRKSYLLKNLKKVAERVGFEPTFSTVKIKKLQEKSKEAVPSRPLKSPDFAVDLAIARYH
jgi:hypothetical protein